MTLGALAIAYKIGEQKASINQFDFFVTTQAIPQGQSTPIPLYITISSGGRIEFTPDMNQATVFNYFDAIKIRSILRKYAEPMPLSLETVSNYITTQA